MADTVLAVGSHPDDIELGMGGTVAALIARGVRVVVVDLSDGEPTPEGSAAIRAAETKRASDLLGVVERINLGLTCREIMDTIEARRKLATVIREFCPTLLFAPYWEDAHPDHVQASALCDAARFYSKFVKTDLPHSPHSVRRIWYYLAVHLRSRAQPSVLVDVSAHIDVKRAALEAYHSQFVANPRNAGFIDRIIAENQYWGSQAYCAFAEPFVCRENVRLGDPSLLLSV